MPNQEFAFKPSKQYLGLYGAMFLASLMIIFILDLPLGIRLLLLIAVSCYMGYQCWRFILLRSQHSILRIQWLGEGQWQIATRDHCYRASLCGHSTVTPFLSVLRFRIAKQWRPVSCVIFRDSLGAENYRRLFIEIKKH